MTRLVQGTDQLVRKAAFATTRRRFLRNGGAGALGLALGTAFAGSGRRGLALAHGTANHPCGPSPLCPKHRCYHGNCSNAPGRVYNHWTCNPRRNGGCWPEDYRSQGKGQWLCCDCCALDGGGHKCSSCGDSRKRKACICRSRIG